MNTTEFWAILGFTILTVIVLLIKLAKLENSQIRHVIHTSDMQDICMLQTGNVHAVLLRQSGNTYRDLGVFTSANVALAAVQTSFRRSGVEEVIVQKNGKFKFHIIRLFHNHRGQNEGKKLGGAILHLL